MYWIRGAFDSIYTVYFLYHREQGKGSYGPYTHMRLPLSQSEEWWYMFHRQNPSNS